MPAPDKIRQLVETFEQNLNDYRTHKNETELRRQFLDPFFEALGWDVGNAKGYDERHKEVAHELSVEIDGQQKKADYAFRTGVDKFDFLVEAKKPSVKIESNPDPAFQVRRYGWSAKLPISILTDFEHFAVYDCRAKPSHKDKVSTGRILLVHYRDYIEKWDEIAALFSPDAIRKGALDKFSEGAKGRKGTADVDDDFLAEIERWRELLARNIALRNKDKGLTEAELNFAVQMTIDRIVFLRIAEERGMEEYRRLKNLCDYDDIYTLLKQYFLKADERYNSGLFHFKSEKERKNPDTVTPDLQIDDKVLRDIIENLYEPKSPYAFAYIPADILGSVYERFLGKVIRLTAGGGAKVEDKPEVRKAGGVYYTPVYIVEYIVKNTVGKLVEGKTPKEVAEIKVVDPACGSGSFLLGAYQYLLNWHLDWYVNNDLERALKRKVILTQDHKTFRLSMDEKKRILLNNIHGVDVDPQAVEVTKLSLLLKVVEDPGQLRMFEEGHILPDLGNNIKCGNSLIGTDYFDGQLITDPDEIRRINPFDWRSAFPDVFKRGGFDIVIGNPPYVRPHNLEPEAKEYFWRTYKSFVKKSDLYSCFIEKSISLMKPNGLFSYIVSNGWLRLDSFEELRKILLERTSIKTIIEFEDMVFDATVKTLIFVLSKGYNQENKTSVATIPANTDLSKLNYREIQQEVFKKSYKNIFDLSLNDEAEQIKQKMISKSIALGSSFLLAFGLKTGDDELFLGWEKKSDQHKPLLRGANIHRYQKSFDGEYVWYVPEKMTAHRKTARPGNAKRFEQPKVLIRDTGGALEGTYDNDGYYVKDVLVVSHQTSNVHLLKYLCGVLNSRLMKFYYETSFPTLHVQRDELASLPIVLNFADPAERARHDQMVTLVERMLALHKTLASAKTPQERESVQGQIRSTDEAIDRLVYELYGLSDEEIRIVEG